MEEPEKIEQLYNILQPIVNLIEEKKAEIDELIYDIEFDESLPDEQWKVSETIGSAVVELSLSGGDTAVKDLRYLVNGPE